MSPQLADADVANVQAPKGVHSRTLGVVGASSQMRPAMIEQTVAACAVLPWRIAGVIYDCDAGGPTMAERIRSPESCRNVARFASGKVALEEPASSIIAPTSHKVVQRLRLGQFCPCWAMVPPSSARLDDLLSLLPENWPTWAKVWPTPAHVGRRCSRLGQIWAKMSRPEFVKFGANLGSGDNSPGSSVLAGIVKGNFPRRTASNRCATFGCMCLP